VAARSNQVSSGSSASWRFESPWNIQIRVATSRDKEGDLRVERITNEAGLVGPPGLPNHQGIAPSASSLILLLLLLLFFFFLLASLQQFVSDIFG